MSACEVVLLAVSVFTGSLAAAQTATPSLTVQTATGQATFHIGERISLVLTFVCPNDGQFDIAPWEDERGGEFGYFEDFAVSPASGWIDPLREFFDGRFPNTSHGWFWDDFSPHVPVTVKLDLNQWVRFENPGDYSIRIRSHRVGRTGRSQPLEIVGGIQLHIVAATPEWQSDKLSTILFNLKSPSIAVWEDAMADLRYLGTADSIDELTAQLSNTDANSDHKAELGLIALPVFLRDQALASMNRRIEQPDFPVSFHSVRAMEYLHISPDLDGKTADAKIHDYAPALWLKIYAAIPGKQPGARAVTVRTLLEYGNNIPGPEVWAKMSSLKATVEKDEPSKRSQ